MNKTLFATLSLALSLVLLEATFGQTSGQTLTGIGKFQTRDMHQYDSINLADLSISTNIPIRNKTGVIRSA
jgi:hypothetical protein